VVVQAEVLAEVMVVMEDQVAVLEVMVVMLVQEGLVILHQLVLHKVIQVDRMVQYQIITLALVEEVQVQLVQHHHLQELLELQVVTVVMVQMFLQVFQLL
jgi:hypothetical protein